MSESSLHVLVATYESVAGQLKAARAELSAIENRTVEPCGSIHFDRTPTLLLGEAERLRARITDLEVELAAVGAAVDKISNAEDERCKQAEAHAKWKAIVPECRAARVARDKLGREFEVNETKLENARNHVEFVQHELEVHKRNLLQPSDYPLETELEREKEQTAKLEKEVLKARAACKELAERRADVQMAWLRARSRFEQLAAQEIRLRPPTKNRPVEEFRVMSIG